MKNQQVIEEEKHKDEEAISEEAKILISKCRPAKENDQVNRVLLLGTKQDLALVLADPGFSSKVAASYETLDDGAIVVELKGQQRTKSF